MVLLLVIWTGVAPWNSKFFFA
uniref:Uncharacterized protein n=1 Tax=Arundo donax TaxID=35708 RepID=A0A0A8Z851_ARUDO